MAEVLEYTRHVHQTRNDQRQGGTSNKTMDTGGTSLNELGVLEAKLVTVDRELKEKIRLLEADIQQYTRDIEDLTKARDSKAAQLEELKRQLRSRHHQPNAGGSRSTTGINYQLDSFDWDRALLKMSKDVFGIEKFRLCQRGCVVS